MMTDAEDKTEVKTTAGVDNDNAVDNICCPRWQIKNDDYNNHGDDGDDVRGRL